MKSILIRLPPEIYRELKVLCARQDISVQKLIYNFINHEIEVSHKKSKENIR